MMTASSLVGYPSVDKPWMKYYTEKEIHAPLPECTIYDFLWESNKEHMDDVAMVYSNQKITYRKLFESINKTAAALSAIGVKSGDIVIMVTVTVPETIYAFYALNRLGAIPDMVDPRTSAEGIRDYILEVKAKYILSLDLACRKIETAIIDTSVEKVVVISPADSLSPVRRMGYRAVVGSSHVPLIDSFIRWRDFLTDGQTANPYFPPYKRGNCCIIVHTGGTTGLPKGVMLSDDSLNGSVEQGDNSGFGFERYQRWLDIMPPFIAYGIVNSVHLPLVKGMTLIIIPNFRPEKYDRLLLKYKPSHVAGVPSHYGTLMQSCRLAHKDLSFIRSPIVGGDGVDIKTEKNIVDFLTEHNCTKGLLKGYGMTEICAAVTGTAVSESNKPGSVGIPYSHSVVSVFDTESGEELTYGETGEICILSPLTMLGYYENKKETAKILKLHKDGNVWVHSGDLGYMDTDGCLFVVGRKKRLIIRHDGFKVFPTLIENVVFMNKAVNACCAIGIRDKSFSQGQLPVVYVVLKPEYRDRVDTVRQELYELCKQELPEYEQPVGFVFKEKLPLTSIGKIDYQALEQETMR